MLLVPFPLIAFITALILTPIIGRINRKRDILSKDLHKKEKPLVPEMTGIAILIAYCVSLLGAYLFLGDKGLLFALALVILVGFLGVIDHYRPLKPWEKIITLTLIGFSYYFYIPLPSDYLLLLIIPLFFMAACNFTNMLAGFNGLEIGVGAIASLGVAAVAYMNNAEVSFVIASTMAAALLAFLYYNKYPAKVFPGDVGTLIIGAALFTAVLYGGLYLPGIIIFIPYALDAGLKFLSAGIMSRHSQEPTLIKGGKLYAPRGGNLSLPRLLLKIKPMGEKEVVMLLWIVEALFASVAVALEVAL